MRSSELVGLNWSDFQLTEEAIAVIILGKGIVPWWLHLVICTFNNHECTSKFIDLD
ncbi:hypothetical protein H1P_2430013 [Hyella patelloides LEGE 07179]|uniref:Uncharacterized protein n=1 Tax=Hyella patelloides LEGE 07179 TaxID=945734 RepID=A0A563VRX9_9CYAN|nr:hypothetical protein H1P_2430013 [Hyella patelloides LEGE 07179]